MLEKRREAIRDALSPQTGGLEIGRGEARWWTFAGGRINTTLRYAFEALGDGWRIMPDNYGLRLRGEDLDDNRFAAALDRLAAPGLWEDAELWEAIARSLPGYRLSKFQPLMPPWIEREVVAEYLLDREGTWQWLQGRAGRSA
jgi:ATP-dependent Lhr-like helicase